MDNIFFFGLALFIIAVLVIEMIRYALRILVPPNRKQFRQRLERFSMVAEENGSFSITHKKILSENPLLDRLLRLIPGIHRINLLLKQGNLKWSPGFYILLTILAFLIGYTIGYVKTRTLMFAIPIALGATSLPFLYLCRKKKQRMEKFIRQLPDGLDFIGRALKAGHAFTSGLKLAAEEFDDPLGPEFEETLEEINFGVSVQEALSNLASRIDCQDLKYFVVSVIVQRETGGNLSEIIGNIAGIIRERFKLYGKVRTLTAEGRLSGIVLVAIPFLMLGMFQIMNPKYIETLFTDPIGKAMSAFGLCSVCIGAGVIKMLMQVKV